jgi:hypothetical protein
MRKRAATTLALATLLALVLTSYTTTSRAQDAQRTVNLSPGCNMVTLTFTSGTQASALTSAVSPASALQTVWRLDNASHSFQAFMPQTPQASDLTSLNILDAAFICVDTPATITMPALSPDTSASPISTNLSAGCNAIGLTFQNGSTPSAVAQAITPADAFQALWRLDNATGSFQAYVAAAPQASDLASLAFLDAVFVCTTGRATLSMLAVEAQPLSVAPAIDDLLTTCPTQQELDRFNADFDIFFDPAANLPPYACQNGRDPGGSVNPLLAVYQALRAMDALTFDQPLPWTSLSLYDWLKSTITGFNIAPVQYSGCCDAQGRIVLKSDLLSQPSYAAWLEPQQSVGLMHFAGLIVHETRHAEGKPHTCNGTEDATLSEMGAWAAQYYFFLWMANHTPPGELSDAEKAAAAAAAADALTRICNPNQ